MSDELAHLEEDLLGQLSTMQDYLSSLETQNSELTARNDELATQHQELLGQLSAAKKYQTALNGQLTTLKASQSLLETQNQTLSGQLKDVKTYQSEVMTRNKELTKQHNELITQNGGLLKTQKEFKLANQSLTESIAALQSEQNQPPVPLMTTTNEPFMSEKDELIERLQKQIASLTARNSEMRATIMLLERR